jgi:hypothetical protein
LVIDPTEALVAIDVNSGRFREHSDSETTALKMNLEAAKEVARQLRLRDLGGVIIIDFIDMYREADRRAVEKALRDAMKTDRAKAKIAKISAFGIVEMTRQRVRPSLKDSLHRPCPYCQGRGVVKSEESLALEVIRELKRAAAHDEITRIEVAVNPDVAVHLSNTYRKHLFKLETDCGKTIFIRPDDHLPGNGVRISCQNARGSEVAWQEQTGRGGRPGQPGGPPRPRQQPQQPRPQQQPPQPQLRPQPQQPPQPPQAPEQPAEQVPDQAAPPAQQQERPQPSQPQQPQAQQPQQARGRPSRRRRGGKGRGAPPATAAQPAQAPANLPADQAAFVPAAPQLQPMDEALAAAGNQATEQAVERAGEAAGEEPPASAPAAIGPREQGQPSAVGAPPAKRRRKTHRAGRKHRHKKAGADSQGQAPQGGGPGDETPNAGPSAGSPAAADSQAPEDSEPPQTEDSQQRDE